MVDTATSSFYNLPVISRGVLDVYMKRHPFRDDMLAEAWTVPLAGQGSLQSTGIGDRRRATFRGTQLRRRGDSM